jgi:hypothetical protein
MRISYLESQTHTTSTTPRQRQIQHHHVRTSPPHPLISDPSHPPPPLQLRSVQSRNSTCTVQKNTRTKNSPPQVLRDHHRNTKTTQNLRIRRHNPARARTRTSNTEVDLLKRKTNRKMEKNHRHQNWIQTRCKNHTMEVMLPKANGHLTSNPKAHVWARDKRS